MGERIDALLSRRRGVDPAPGAPRGQDRPGTGAVITGSGKEPIPAALPSTLDGTVVEGGQLTAAAVGRLTAKAVTARHTVKLAGSMMAYDWGINGPGLRHSSPCEGALEVRQGDRVQIDFVNQTTMWHPMHLR